MDKKVTMADIAALAGVGKSTVSRYFNGGYVKEETRERISRVIADYDYEPNEFARLNAKASNVIGVVVPALNSKVTGRVITSIDRSLRERGYTTVIKNSDHQVQLELQNLKRLARMNVDGIILSSISVTPAHREVIGEAGVPVVVLAQDYEDGVRIVEDDYHAGRQMGLYVGKCGFERIAYIGVPSADEAVGVQRRAGVTSGLREAGARLAAEETGDYSFESGYAAAERLFGAGGRMSEPLFGAGSLPDAVICATDRMAYGVYAYLKERGIRIPEDVSVTGFGGYDESALLDPPLTTLKFDSYQVGRLGAETLLQMLEGQNVPVRQTVGFTWIEGKSVKKKKYV